MRRLMDIRLLPALLLLATAPGLYAQSPEKISFGGAGRLVIDNARLDGPLLDTDTTTARRELGGTALFDLGITIRPDANTEIVSVMRVENDLDGFWGAGIQFQLRQLTAKGVIADAVRYGIGDLDIALTPYTFWNNASEFRVGRTPAFDVFRDVIDYENFYADSAWRQQGLEAEWGLDFSRGIERLTFRGLIAKNRQTDFFTLPDRLMAMGRIGLEVSPAFRAHLNATSFFEVASSAQFNDAASAYQVLTLDATTGGGGERMTWRVDGEGGASRAVYENLADAPADPAEDYVLDLRGTLAWPGSGLTVRAGYADVGPGFRSPAAQTRRLDAEAPARAFGFYTNRETQRPLNVRDLLRDPFVYQRTIEAGLGDFVPGWDNVRPYGAATPNRRGLDLGLRWNGDSARRFEAGVQAALLTEIRGEGTTELRRFADLRLDAAWHAGRQLGWEKALSLHVAARHQRTGRDGVEGVSRVALTSSILETGLTWEVYRRLDLLGGLLYYTASGNEFLAQRDAFTDIVFYDAYATDATEWFATGGMRYRFTESISLTAQYEWLNRADALSPQTDYTIGNVLLLYNMFF